MSILSKVSVARAAGLVSVAFCATCSVRAFDYASFTLKPATVTVDGQPAGARVDILSDGRVILRGGTASFVTLKWPVALGGATRVYGDMWERTYGNSAWRRVDDPKPPREGSMPWYFLATDGTRTDGYGVMTQPNAFASWKAKPDGIELLLDVRAGSMPVELGARHVTLCTLVSRRGRAGESAYAAGRAFCRALCPHPRLPKAPVYGYNDWYCAYGRNTATNFLADVAKLVSLMDAQPGARVTNRPFAVVDDGWQLKERCGDTPGPDGQWVRHNARWGMAMDAFCTRVKALGARPGLWYRPLYPWRTMPEAWKTRGRASCIWKEGDFSIDPTAPGLADFIRADLARFRAWGIELVKIDFITFDWNTRWGYDLGEKIVAHDQAVWRDRSRTGAEVIRGLYAAMREGAGDMYVIGCNAIDHFAAGLFELQRTGDDTSGREWGRTRRMGPNTLGMRAIHDGTFYSVDADCVGLVNADSVPWGFNSQWLELVARSGTALFTSWKRHLATDPDVADALGRAWKIASAPRATGEPLDWVDSPRPCRWKFADGERTFNWDTLPGERGAR